MADYCQCCGGEVALVNGHVMPVRPPLSVEDMRVLDAELSARSSHSDASADLRAALDLPTYSPELQPVHGVTMVPDPDGSWVSWDALRAALAILPSAGADVRNEALGNMARLAQETGTYDIDPPEDAAKAAPVEPPETPRHLFVDSRGRNLCDTCDRWIGAPVHFSPEPASPPDTGAGIEVERLARAIVATFRRLGTQPGHKGTGWPAYMERHDGSDAVMLVVDALARDLANEYRALAEAGGPSRLASREEPTE